MRNEIVFAQIVAVILVFLSFLFVAPLPPHSRNVHRIDGSLSPYLNEIDRFRSKDTSSLTADQVQYYAELVDKHNEWFAREKDRAYESADLSPRSHWRDKSSRLWLPIGLLWLIGLYLAKLRNWIALVSTIVLPSFVLFVGLLSIGAWCAIAVSILGVMLLRLIRDSELIDD